MILPHTLHVAESTKEKRSLLGLVAVFFLVFTGLCQSRAAAQIGVTPMDMGGGRVTMAPTFQPSQILPYGQSYGAPIPLPGVPFGTAPSYGSPYPLPYGYGVPYGVPYGAQPQPTPSGPEQMQPGASSPQGSAGAARTGRGGSAQSPTDKDTKPTVEPTPPRLLSIGERISGAATVGRDGSIMVGGTRVLLDGATLLPAVELCGNGAQMYRCGQIGASVTETILARTPRLRCLVLTAQTAPNAAVTAWCQTGRDDVAALLVRAGAARASDVRQQAWQMEAQGDRRGIWAGGVAR